MKKKLALLALSLVLVGCRGSVTDDAELEMDADPSVTDDEVDAALEADGALEIEAE